jgi:hypothetical protein
MSLLLVNNQIFYTIGISTIIEETLKEGLIKPYDPNNKSKKHSKYVPIWA